MRDRREVGGSLDRRWFAVAMVVAVAVVVSATFVLWDRYARRAGPTNAGTNCPAVVKSRRHEPLAAIGVRRVTLIGDSIMYQPSCAIADSLAGVGVETYRHAVSGTGLLNGAVDWVAATKALLRAEKPDVVVAIFVGNYAPPFVPDAAGHPIGPDTPQFFSAWQRRAAQLSREVRAAGARLYWVSPPPMIMPVFTHAARLFDGYRKLGDHILNSGAVLAGDHGGEVLTKSTCGRRRAIRTSIDGGVHLTDDGARIYGQQIAHDLTADLGLLVTPRPC